MSTHSSKENVSWSGFMVVSVLTGVKPGPKSFRLVRLEGERN